jgi:DNA polymerase-3 subunit delta'
MFKDVLKERQVIVERVLYNALKHKQASHAYLFVGPKGTGMLETAILFAQSLVCPHRDPWACATCEICVRIQENHFTDLILLDGALSSIKKDDVLEMQEQFSKTALESYGKKIYIVNRAENATTEALNSLLKFLEEPSGSDTYAILISEHPDALLETIISRCQTLTFKAQNRQALVAQIDMENNDPYEIQLLSQLVNNVEGMMDLQINDDFKHALVMFGHFIDEYVIAPYKGEIFVQTQLLSKRKEAEKPDMGDSNKPEDKKKPKDVVEKGPVVDRRRLSFFFKIGMLFFKDLMFNSEIHSPVWKHRMTQIRPIMDPMTAFNLFNDAEDKINSNANLALLIDSVLYKLKEANHD